MKVVRADKMGTHYDAPNHWGCWPMRVIGKEETGAEKMWIAVAHFLPGGGGKDDGLPVERVYYVVSGSITLKVGNEEVTLNQGDMVFRPPGEPGEYINKGLVPCTNLVIVVPTK